MKSRIGLQRVLEDVQGTENSLEQLTQNSTGNAVLDRCEKVMENAREIDDGKKEYHIITSYLNDIELIENMAPDQAEEVRKAAEFVAKLNRERDQFLNTSKKLSDQQFRMIQLQEDTIPDAVKMLRENEVYQTKVKRDMQYLEGEKREWEIQKKSRIRQKKILRKVSFFLFAVVASVAALLLVLSFGMQMDLQYAWIAVIAVALLSAAFILLQLETGRRDIRQAEVNINYAIVLLNKVKIKYVNITNAVDYTRERYHVRDAREFAYQWEMYQEAVREHQKYMKTNEDLNYYYDKLTALLKKHKLYDFRVWMEQPQALVEPKEMVEIKHNLIVRRQKLRSKIAYNLDIVKRERAEIDKMLKADANSGEQNLQALELIASIDRMAELSKES